MGKHILTKNGITDDVELAALSQTGGNSFTFTEFNNLYTQKCLN